MSRTDPARRIAALGLALALLALGLRALVPAGWMPAVSPGGLTMTLCTGAGVEVISLDKNGQPVKAAKADGGPCAFSGLGTPLLDALPPAVVLPLLAFLLALGFAPVVRPALATTDWLRPPLRGPPARA